MYPFIFVIVKPVHNVQYICTVLFQDPPSSATPSGSTDAPANSDVSTRARDVDRVTDATPSFAKRKRLRSLDTFRG